METTYKGRIHFQAIDCNLESEIITYPSELRFKRRVSVYTDSPVNDCHAIYGEHNAVCFEELLTSGCMPMGERFQGLTDDEALHLYTVAVDIRKRWDDEAAEENRRIEENKAERAERAERAEKKAAEKKMWEEKKAAEVARLESKPYVFCPKTGSHEGEYAIYRFETLEKKSGKDIASKVERHPEKNFFFTEESGRFVKGRCLRDLVLYLGGANPWAEANA